MISMICVGVLSIGVIFCVSFIVFIVFIVLNVRLKGGSVGCSVYSMIVIIVMKFSVSSMIVSVWLVVFLLKWCLNVLIFVWFSNIWCNENVVIVSVDVLILFVVDVGLLLINIKNMIIVVEVVVNSFGVIMWKFAVCVIMELKSVIN